MLPEPVSFESDCSNCASLCCFAYAFTKGVEFPIEKDADELCPHIGKVSGCQIHANRAARGFTGCIKYECLGAGQRVVQEVFKGASWRDDPALLKPMSEGLRVMKVLHEMLQLLETVEILPLTPEETRLYQDLLARAMPETPFTPESLIAFPVYQLRRDVTQFIRGLAHHVSSQRRADQN
ncbi:MAG: hypothetical protein CMK09_09280 [Ponticaulis sp.]|nr:hypothetical protein [Ponticaulis sp.]|tara:strand:+ start:23448 stop:23987 length:540 start_codon:yes stop_codon:yes gene_type:complete